MFYSLRNAAVAFSIALVIVLALTGMASMDLKSKIPDENRLGLLFIVLFASFLAAFVAFVTTRETCELERLSFYRDMFQLTEIFAVPMDTLAVMTRAELQQFATANLQGLGHEWVMAERLTPGRPMAKERVEARQVFENHYSIFKHRGLLDDTDAGSDLYFPSNLA